MSEKVAIVTAASRGIGEAIARKLHKEGYRLALMSRSDDLFKVSNDTDAISLQGSTTKKGDLDVLVETTIKEYGRIDAIVCNTGHPPKGDLLEITGDEWSEGMDLAFMCLVHLMRKATPYLKDSKGSVVAISTFAAVEPSLDFPVSSVARAALGAFIKLYADRFGGEGVRINSVLPGYIETFEVAEEKINRIPLDRPGKRDEIANTVSFLLSDAAGYITGQNIRVDGGLSRSL